jgi:poly-gamma-glutamate synthesis protein (capsule biosynthesis protein)
VLPVAAFPYVFVDDDPAPDYLRFRAEGLSFEESLPHALDYLKKAVDKKLTASTAEVEYFQRQAALLDALAVASTDPGAVEKKVVLGLVGDLMWIRDGWDTFLDPRILQYMQGTDFWLGNLETPIAASFEVPSKFTDYKNFNSAPGLVQSFLDAAGSSLFEALSFANNHTLDMTDKGAEETLAFIEGQGILPGGARVAPGDRFVTFEKGGILFGATFATWGLNEPSLMETTDIEIDWVPGLAPEGKQLVDLTDVRNALDSMAADGVDFRIVFLHWGHEYEVYPSPLQVRVARELVAGGADLVVGSHPHVQQPIEVCFVDGGEAALVDAGLDAAALTSPDGCVIASGGKPRKALVMYSLGNFASAMSTFMCQAGMLARISVYRTGDGSVDFDIPSHAFVVNQVDFPPPDGTHRLLPVDAYFEQDCFDPDGACEKDVESEWSLVRGIVHGPEETIP